MLHLEIRRPSSRDTEELCEFFRIVITDTFMKEGIEELLDDIEDEINSKIIHLENDFESGGTQHYFLIAVHKREIIGSIEIGPANEIIRNATNMASQDSIELGTVFVHPHYQRNGVGNVLLKAMYSAMRQKGIKEFMLDSGYKTAQQIWAKKFGESQYLLKDYWGKANDHMIWKVNIDDVAEQ
ncbi:GNAT family N-acetyltransferase [Paenibacillus sp. YSY-4.3]